VAIFLLVRHAATDLIDTTLAGWTEGVHLNEEGRAQARALAERLRRVAISALYSSPLDRALETAELIGGPMKLQVRLCDEAGEVRFGDWTGREFKALHDDLSWNRFNTLRSLTRPPGGEMILEVQARMTGLLNRLSDLHPGATVAIVTHADVIRGTIAHYAGIHPDLMHRLEISPASISIIDAGEFGPRILRVNDAG